MNMVVQNQKVYVISDIHNLADWIQSKPFYINLELDGVKYQIAHAQTYLSPERLWDKRKIYMGDGRYTWFLQWLEVF